MGNGYLSGNMLVAFPFEDGQCLAWEVDSAERRNELQLALQRCFVDAVAYVDSEGLSAAEWPVVGSFSIVGNAISFKMGSGDAQGDAGVSVAASSVVFPIVSGSAAWGRYMLVLSSEGIRDFISLCDDLSISPPVQDFSSSLGRDGGFWLRLCAKCITVRPHGLSSLKVYDGVNPRTSGPHFVMRGDISIRPGNNIQLRDPEGGGIAIDAIPGAGLGKCPCICAENEDGNSRLAGYDGHARFFNDGCYDIEPLEKYYDSGLGMMSQALKIHAKCTACCTCEMYEEIVNGRLVPLAEALRSAKSDIESMLAKYEDAVGRFNARIEVPKVSDVTMTLSAMPIGKNVSPNLSADTVVGRMSRCAYTAVIRNSSYFEVLARIDSLAGTDSVVESSATWSDDEGKPLSITGDSAAGLVGRTFSIYPGRSLVVTYISRKDAKVKSVVTGGFRGSARVVLSYRDKEGNVSHLGSVSKTIDA